MTGFNRLRKEQLRAVAEPIWRNIVSAARQRDYARFSTGFSDELRSRLGEEHFRQSCGDFPLLTTIEPEFECIDSIQRQRSITILWRLRSSGSAGEFLGQLTLQAGDDGMEIAGVSVS